MSGPIRVAGVPMMEVHRINLFMQEEDRWEGENKISQIICRLSIEAKVPQVQIMFEIQRM